MANYWKIGSRWSQYGEYSSRIISVFRRSGVVFLGTNVERFQKEVHSGDYFAIADGYTIVSVARATSEPMPLNDLIKSGTIKVRAGDPFDISEDYEGCYGVRVKIVDLPQNKRLSLKKMGTFFRLNPSMAKSVHALYEDNLSAQFDIKSHTYRVMATKGQKDDKLSIIDHKTFYNIPVYQREYSWGHEQVSRFVGDILKGYWGVEETKVIKMEPMFIGTMQLSYKKYISGSESEQDVIDGQQRLSTILCLLKYLSLRYPDNNCLSSINFDWLETRVNNGKEDAYLKSMLSVRNLSDVVQVADFDHNRYAQNLLIISECFDELTTTEEGKFIPIFEDNISLFIDYILNSIYFVVVETVAGLSKTIQIFNTINTAGLDLNGNDLFKVRLYEYLHDVKNAGEEAFNEIGEIYKYVKDKNTAWRRSHDYDVISVGNMRSVYKYYLISKYHLPRMLYSKSTDTFFDELFDVLLNVQSHDGLKDLKGLELSLDDLKRICDVIYLWNTSEYRNDSEYISYTLIKRSRYSRYSNIAYLILLANESLPVEERFDQVYECLSSLAKLFFCWSIMFAKAVNEIHTFMQNLYRKTSSYLEHRDEILNMIREKTASKNNTEFKEKCIGQPVADNRTWKDLICVLSAYFDEHEQGTPVDKMEQLFDGGYDIEHIHANANDQEGTDIPYELQNSIGNLMVLEYDINRSIGCIPFREKKERSSREKCYKDSNYATVKKICQYEDWLLPNVEKRREEEIEKIANFLFNNK